MEELLKQELEIAEKDWDDARSEHIKSLLAKILINSQIIPINIEQNYAVTKPILS